MSLSSDSKEGDPESSKSGHRARNRYLIYIIAALLVCGALGLGVVALQQRGVDVVGALGKARDTSEDAATTAAVKTAFALSSKVSAFAVDVTTNDGVVRLDGVVPSEPIRELAVAIARDTTGVAAVEDSLEVEPDTRPSPEIEALRNRIADLEIRAELDSKLLRNPELVGHGIRIDVDERIVTIEGEIASSELARRVEDIARSADRVVHVENDLTVLEPAADVSDVGDAVDANGETRPLTKHVRFELYATGAFNLDHVEVRATDGVVTLTGRVRSQAEKLLAEQIARDVRGVKDVSNELEVVAIPFRADTTGALESDTRPPRSARAPSPGVAA